VILTREPGESIRFLHDRMPLMLPEEYAKEWIRPDADPAELVRAAQTDIQYERLG
jgi:putative SOS response-associated peptidase YedK